MTDKRDRMKVWHPTAPLKRVDTIAGDDDHFGNLVAEGFMDESEYYPMLVRSARGDAKRERAKWLALRTAVETEAYAAGWIARWLDYEGPPTCSP